MAYGGHNTTDMHTVHDDTMLQDHAIRQMRAGRRGQQQSRQLRGRRTVRLCRLVGITDGRDTAVDGIEQLAKLCDASTVRAKSVSWNAPCCDAHEAGWRTRAKMISRNALENLEIILRIESE